MTTSLDTIRYHSGIAGEEVADMVDSLEQEVSTLREQVEKLEAAGHRLALELECLLLDCKDNVVASRWMDTAYEALDAWRNLFPYNGPRLGD